MWKQSTRSLLQDGVFMSLSHETTKVNFLSLNC